MENEIFGDKIYEILKLKLQMMKTTFTHTEVEKHTETIASTLFDITDKKLIAHIVARYEENHNNIEVNEPDVLLADLNYGKWFEKQKEVLQHSLKDGFITRYKRFLRTQDFDESVIEQIEIESENILKQCANPEMSIHTDERKKRGLVVGDVQSGKTANYLGLINLACDYGYKIIVLLAGMTDSLRQQTQSRIDEGFIGAISDTIGNENMTIIGVGEMAETRQHHAIPLTNNESDFIKFVKKNYNFTSGDFRKPVVLVVKKNAGVLEQLTNWLNPKMANINYENILIIDDEADNASVNTSKPECDPSKINEQIRGLYNNFPIASYVGYTATPFANIFINPEKRECIEELFPADFIILLNAPTNYFGSAKVFGFEGEKNSRYIREIMESEKHFLPPKHKKDQYQFHTMPDSMKEAVLCFLLNNVIRTIKGAEKKHRSMMINISVLNGMHGQIKETVEKYIDQIKFIIEQDVYKPTEEFIKNKEMAKLNGIYTGCREYLKNEVDFYKEFREDISWEQVKQGLYKEITKFEIVVINNSNKKNRFSYQDAKYVTSGARVIVIGGYVLSRGLTLEGLMISYFSRNSCAYDALLQMCRWFGYRPGYEELCRVYISAINIMNFRAVIDAVENLKMQFREMIIRKKKPIDFGLMVQESPDTLETSLLVTSRNKMYHTGKIVHTINYGGTYADTSKLFTNLSHNEKNKTVIEEMFQQIVLDKVAKWETQNGKEVLCEVDSRYIADYIKKLTIPFENIKFDVQNLATYIKTNKSFPKWDIIIATGSAQKEYRGKNAVIRSCIIREGEKIIRIGDKNNRIIDPGIFATILSQDELKVAKIHAINRVEQAKKGNPDNLTVPDYLAVIKRPVFIVYPMKLKNADEDVSIKERENQLYSEIVFGFAIGFPAKEHAERMIYRANKVKIDEIDRSRFEPEIDEEFSFDD